MFLRLLDVTSKKTKQALLRLQCLEIVLSNWEPFPKLGQAPLWFIFAHIYLIPQNRLIHLLGWLSARVRPLWRQKLFAENEERLEPLAVGGD